jgi:hypothetical protein
MTGEQLQPVFGFPDFWAKAYQEHRAGFEVMARDMALGNTMFRAAEAKSMAKVQLVIYMLVRMVATGLSEVMVLAGNGLGRGR